MSTFSYNGILIRTHNRLVSRFLCMPLFDVEYVGNVITQEHSYIRVLCALSNGVISNNFEWPFKVMTLFNIKLLDKTMYKIDLYSQWQTNWSHIWSVKCCHIQNILEWLRTQTSVARHYSALNVSETVKLETCLQWTTDRSLCHTHYTVV